MSCPNERKLITYNRTVGVAIEGSHPAERVGSSCISYLLRLLQTFSFIREEVIRKMLAAEASWAAGPASEVSFFPQVELPSKKLSVTKSVYYVPE